MSKIIKTSAYSNGEIAYLGWQVSEMIPGCLGFAILRQFPDDPTQNKFLAAWVPFKGQSNPDWEPQDTSVWPIQKLSWRDLTLIKSRNSLNQRAQGFRVQYLIRPVVAFRVGLEEVKTTNPKTYQGDVVRLAYLDEGLQTNMITVTNQFGPVRATFNNGILSTQWLSNVIKKQNPPKVKKFLLNSIAAPGNAIRTYLAGQALDTMKLLIQAAQANPNASLRLALYEFDDLELYNLLFTVKDRIEIILSNTGANDKAKQIWDTENKTFRGNLHAAGVKITDRFFNNGHIGHNKFVIYLENGVPLKVLTGSTNWTPNGLCAQSNNAAIIEDKAVGAYYNAYFDALKADNDGFSAPNPNSDPTSNVQGKAFRGLNAKGNAPVTMADGSQISVWFSPNTPSGTVNKKVTPPDLSAVYSLMRKAEKAIFFAVFLPGMSDVAAQGDILTNVITEAISIGQKDNSLLVYGSISSPMAMPNYVKPKKGGSDDDDEDDKTPQPATYDSQNVHIVRAINLSTDDIVGNFEAEQLTLGNAIIHNKIIVIDPFSENPAVILGSHNMGFKASYGNDENLVIVQGNKLLVQAYAAHVLDIYEHYRFRAVQEELHEEGKREFDGFLSIGDGWLEKARSATGKGSLADYLCSGQ